VPAVFRNTGIKKALFPPRKERTAPVRLAAFFGNFRKSGTVPDRLHDRLYPRYYSILITVTIG
jgi:hypothetical protein